MSTFTERDSEGGEIEKGEVMGEKKRRDDMSVGMEEHSSQQSLSCLLPQHKHTSPCPVGFQVSGAALKGPQSLPSGKLTAVGKGDTQSHKNTCTYKYTRPYTQTNPSVYDIMHMHTPSTYVHLTLSDTRTHPPAPPITATS